MEFNISQFKRFYYSDVDKESLILLIISDMHLQNKITDAKLKGMVRSLREGKLIRFVRTFHCGINDKWYSDESMFDVLINVHDEICNERIIQLDEFFYYLNLLHNKNKNYCVDNVYNTFVKPLINNIQNSANYQILKSYGVEFNYLTFEDADKKYNLGSGYCCEDCDGDYFEFKRFNYQHYYKFNNDVIFNDFKNHLRSYKTHLKNPNDILKTNELH